MFGHIWDKEETLRGVVQQPAAPGECCEGEACQSILACGVTRSSARSSTGGVVRGWGGVGVPVAPHPSLAPGSHQHTPHPHRPLPPSSAPSSAPGRHR